MKAFTYISAIFCFFTVSSVAQSLEDNVTVLFQKAQVLYETERYDEAVRMYNQILNGQDDFAPALLMRGKAKYELGAYKGTKADVMEFIALQGVTKDVIKLMGQTEQQLGNQKAAMNYVTTAIELDPYDSELYLVKGYIHFTQKDKSEACELWSRAAKLGDRRARALLEEHCAILAEIEEMRAIQQTEEKENDEETEVTDDKEVETKEDSEDKKAEKPLVIEEPDRDAIQEVEIDEELSIVIGNGLGERKVDSNPDLFIVSDKAGKVVIDVCVDGKGKVIDSVINKKLTTLFKTSLTSLALRKSKEFKFYPSFRDEQCGYLIYVIKPVE
jgi:predicted negative regulator of RcsB-dependent stress response